MSHRKFCSDLNSKIADFQKVVVVPNENNFNIELMTESYHMRLRLAGTLTLK